MIDIEVVRDQLDKKLKEEKEHIESKAFSDLAHKHIRQVKLEALNKLKTEIDMILLVLDEDSIDHTRYLAFKNRVDKEIKKLKEQDLEFVNSITVNENMVPLGNWDKIGSTGTMRGTIKSIENGD